MVTVTEGMTGHDLADATIHEVKQDFPYLKDITLLSVALVRVCTKYVLREALMSEAAESNIDRAVQTMSRDAQRLSKARHPSRGIGPCVACSTGQEHGDPGAHRTQTPLPRRDPRDTDHYIKCPNCDEAALFDPNSKLRVYCHHCMYNEQA